MWCVRHCCYCRCLPAGPLWRLFSHIVEGRVVVRGDGVVGCVVCPKFHDYTNRLAPKYLVGPGLRV